MKKILCILFTLLILINIPVCTINATDTVSASKYINMKGDFSKETNMPEHYLWCQGCRKDCSSGVCTCNSKIHASKATKAYANCWSGMLLSPSFSSIRHVGCYVTSLCMMMVESGAVDPTFTPDDFFLWCAQNGAWDASGNFRDRSKIGAYTNGKLKYVDNPVLSAHSKEAQIQAIEKVLQNGEYLIGWVNDGGHAVFILGTGINPKTKEKDIIICDPFREGASMYLYDGETSVSGNIIDQFHYYLPTGCTPFENKLSSASQEDGLTVNNNSIFVDDKEIVINSVDFQLNKVNDSDKLRLNKIQNELIHTNQMEKMQAIGVISKVLGSIVLLYTLALLICYLLDISCYFADINFVQKITFGRFIACVCSDDIVDTKSCLTVKRLIIYLIIGIIGSGLLFNTTGLINTINKVYIMLKGV